VTPYSSPYSVQNTEAIAICSGDLHAGAPTVGSEHGVKRYICLEINIPIGIFDVWAKQKEQKSTSLSR